MITETNKDVNSRVKKPIDYINAYLNQYSDKTRKEYMRDVKQFYQYMQDKDVLQLSNHEMYCDSNGEHFTKSDIISYRTYLISKAKEEKRKNYEGTVKRKIYTLRGFFKFLQGENFSTNYMIFDTKGITYTPKSYDVLEKEQALILAEYIKDKHRFGQELFSFIIISAVTSVRVNALCNITFDNVRYHDERFYTINTGDVREKGSKVVSMPIEHWMYEMLLENNSASLVESNRVFPNLTPDIIHDAITTSAKELGFKGRITTHSLRKMAASYEMKTRGNLKLGMMQTNHSSAEVFMNSYVDKTAHFSELSGIRMFYNIDDSIFDKVSKEQLLELLKELNSSAYEQLAFAVIDRKL